MPTTTPTAALGGTAGTTGPPDSPSRDEQRARTRAARSARRRAQVTTFGVLGLPGVALYAIAVIAPVILCVRYSLLDYNLLTSQGEFVGLDNYRDVIGDPDIRGAFGFTIVLTVVSAVVANGCGVALAVLLDRPRRMYHVLRTFVFVPVILSGIVIAFLWSTILADEGLLNGLLDNLGLTSLQQSWLGTERGAQLSVILVSSWPAIGFCTVVFLAGLQTVPREIVEAAQVDGASGWQVFRSVTWPLLRPALVVNFIVMTINGFKAYDVSLVLTGGGPAGTTETSALQVLRIGFSQNRPGVASAAAILLLVAVALTAAAGTLLTRREN